jgi:hypothetical protein
LRLAAGAQADPSAGKRRGVLRLATRGLVMTPWFAAASGVVIAASLWVYSPHPQLEFPNNLIRRQHCQQHNCAPAVSKKGSGSLATSSKRRFADRPKSARRSGADPRVRNQAAAGLDVSYFVVWNQSGKFVIRISVTSKDPIKDWTLAFVLHADRIRRVWDANWQRASRDSGTASGSGGAVRQWPGGGQDGRGQSDGDHQQYEVSFLVAGTGAPAQPTSCAYDGVTCTVTTGGPASSGQGVGQVQRG